MEVRDYNWLLSSLGKNSVQLSILETAVCRGNKVRSVYCTNSSGYVTRTKKEVKSTPELIAKFSETRLLGVHRNDYTRPVAYLYFSKDTQVAFKTEVEEIVYTKNLNQDLRYVIKCLSTIHEPSKVLKVCCYLENGQVTCDIFSKYFGNENPEQVQNQRIREDSFEFCGVLAKAVREFSGMKILRLEFELVIDSQFKMHLLYVNTIDLIRRKAQSPKSYGAMMKFDDLQQVKQINESSNRHTQLHLKTLETETLESKESKEQSSAPFKEPHNTEGYSNFIEILKKTFKKEKRAEEIKHKLNPSSKINSRSRSDLGKIIKVLENKHAENDQELQKFHKQFTSELSKQANHKKTHSQLPKFSPLSRRSLTKSIPKNNYDKAIYQAMKNAEKQRNLGSWHPGIPKRLSPDSRYFVFLDEFLKSESNRLASQKSVQKLDKISDFNFKIAPQSCKSSKCSSRNITTRKTKTQRTYFNY